MGTTFAKVLTQSAMNFIDDVRWSEQLAENPAVFFRSKSQILINAIPRFNRPPQIKQILKDYNAPKYDSFSHAVEHAEEGYLISIDTGMAGFDLCCVGLIEDDEGNSIYTPLNAAYDSGTGVVTLTAFKELNNCRIDCDFYTDGSFNAELDDTQIRLLGLCIAVDWFFQFSMTYLSVANLVTDKTFDLRSPAEHMRVATGRYEMLQRQLSSELLAYEQNVYAVGTVNQWPSLR